MCVPILEAYVKLLIDNRQIELVVRTLPRCQTRCRFSGTPGSLKVQFQTLSLISLVAVH